MNPANKPAPPQGQAKKKEEPKPTIESAVFSAAVGVVSEPYKFEITRPGDLPESVAVEVKITRHAKPNETVGNCLIVQMDQLPRFIAACQEVLRNIVPKLNDYGRPKPDPEPEQ